VGLALMRALIDSTDAAGVWTIKSRVFPENVASLRLHERAGFRVVGVRERLGRHHGTWRRGADRAAQPEGLNPAYLRDG
jgi:L-amino acid N-acyltransferase YncA